MALLACSRVALPAQRYAVASPLVAGRRALHVARAKTESVDLAPGTPAPFFEVGERYACRWDARSAWPQQSQHRACLWNMV